jgi:hypothetical protein
MFTESLCSSLIQKKKLKKIYFSSYKLPKQQSTSFWSQGILGVNMGILHSSNTATTYVMVHVAEIV